MKIIARRMVPAILIIIMIGNFSALVALAGMLMGGEYQDMLMYMSIWIVLVSFFLRTNAAYQISWDDERITMRNLGKLGALGRNHFSTIKFSDVTRVKAEFGPNASAKRHFMPFEYIEILSEDPRAKVEIHPSWFLHQDEVKEVLQKLSDTHPGILPDTVAAYLSSDRDI